MTDSDLNAESWRTLGNGEYGLTREALVFNFSAYVGDPDIDLAQPSISPLRTASLKGLPPAFIAIAEYDPLRDSGHAYGERLQASGGETTVVL